MKYIVKKKNVLGGSPVVIGTRIPVERLAILVRKFGYEESQLKEEFPGINTKTLRGAIGELVEKGAASI